MFIKSLNFFRIDKLPTNSDFYFFSKYISNNILVTHFLIPQACNLMKKKKKLLEGEDVEHTIINITQRLHFSLVYFFLCH